MWVFLCNCWFNKFSSSASYVEKIKDLCLSQADSKGTVSSLRHPLCDQPTQNKLLLNHLHHDTIHMSTKCASKTVCVSFLILDQTAEEGDGDVGEGEGGEEAGERKFSEWASPFCPAVWLVHAGPSGMFRSLHEPPIVHTTMKRHELNGSHVSSPLDAMHTACSHAGAALENSLHFIFWESGWHNYSVKRSRQ